MIRLASSVGAAILMVLPANLGATGPGAVPRAAPLPAMQSTAVEKAAAPAPKKLHPTVEDVMQSGTLIVVSKASQRMYVFKDGEPWKESPVSTGKRGHATPSGVFPILQKAVKHRSNLYANAPMPYMQRLTWDGIAIHAGHLPGYPASHGCIRVPYSFARALFAQTRASSTAVVVTSESLASHSSAGVLALNTARPEKADSRAPQLAVASESKETASPRIAYLPLLDSPAPAQSDLETVQLAASLSPDEADAHWALLVSRHPELSNVRKTVTPAVVGARRYYRLRITAPDAHAICASLKADGQACFNVG